MMSSFSLGEVDRKRAGLPDLERQGASGIARSDAPASRRATSTPNRNPPTCAQKAVPAAGAGGEQPERRRARSPWLVVPDLAGDAGDLVHPVEGCVALELEGAPRI